MEKKRVSLIILIVLMTSPVVTAALVLSDGQSHTFSNYLYNGLEIDPVDDIIPGTHVNLVTGGEIGFVIYLHNHSTMNINGGKAKTSIIAEDNSVLTITDGFAPAYNTARGNATVNILGGNTEHFDLLSTSKLFMSGGTLEGLDCHSDSTAVVSGGVITGSLEATGNGIVYLRGTDFKVNGQTLSYGDRLSDFVPVVPSFEEHYKRTGNITGTLVDGTTLDCVFNIYYWGGVETPADIIVIPEPTTLALLGMGSFLIHKRKKQLCLLQPSAVPCVSCIAADG